MIGGNTTGKLQVRATTKNEIGESVQDWHDVINIKGWLDLSNGDSRRTIFNAKIQESTHVFISDYLPIPATLVINSKSIGITAESSRMVIKSGNYDVMLIDDPMEMHKQLEIYLKYTGGQ